ncbi:hypothetical protein HOY80DRAFT_1005169 [Tuber brumale]|nr:hypothetical protein HOY80DRAFT_1005169 [Tuber brumale]
MDIITNYQVGEAPRRYTGKKAMSGKFTIWNAEDLGGGRLSLHCGFWRRNWIMLDAANVIIRAWWYKVLRNVHNFTAVHAFGMLEISFEFDWRSNSLSPQQIIVQSSFPKPLIAETTSRSGQRYAPNQRFRERPRPHYPQGASSHPLKLSFTNNGNRLLIPSPDSNCNRPLVSSITKTITPEMAPLPFAAHEGKPSYNIFSCVSSFLFSKPKPAAADTKDDQLKLPGLFGLGTPKAERGEDMLKAPVMFAPESTLTETESVWKSTGFGNPDEYAELMKNP